MKNLKSNIAETGILETALVLSKYEDEEIIDRAAMYIPATYENLTQRAECIRENLLELKKDKIMLLSPEIAFIEQLQQTDFKEVIVCLPSDYDKETYKRIAANIPKNISVELITENEIDGTLFSSNAAIVTFGFSSYEGDRAWILNSNYRMMERFRSFYGYKILASYGNNMSGLRPVGWAPVNTYDFFNEVI